jgi:hypothetical protein
MNAIKVDTTVDQALADAVPELRPLIGKRIHRKSSGPAVPGKPQ